MEPENRLASPALARMDSSLAPASRFWRPMARRPLRPSIVRWMAAWFEMRASFEQMLEVAFARRMCCSRSEEHTSELQSQSNLVCRLLLEKKKPHSKRRRAALRPD